LDFQRILKELGVDLPKDARILDFGCGAGNTVRKLLDSGYINAVGYDVTDGPSLLGHHRADFITTGSLFDLRLPYPNDSFDLILSEEVFEHVMDQVRVFSELHRITRVGGHGVHSIPARYAPIEPHIYVPFGGLFTHRWWYKLWAVLGIRNPYQKELSAEEVAERNAYYAIEALRYVPNSCYRVVWKKIGFSPRFAEQEFLRSHPNRIARLLGRLPGIAWLYRNFRTRIVYLQKRES
jgi:SAM-dependent methyltransferase